MRGTSGRDAKICRPLSRSTASAPDPAPAERICAPSALRVARGPAARAAAGRRSVAAASSTAMRRSVRAIGQSRVGNPPVGARLRLRSASRAAIVASMVKRRVLLPSLVAMFVLLGSGQALAAQWLGSEPLDASGNATVPADVAATGDRSAAIWIALDDHVYVSERPRGGPWGPREDLNPSGFAVPAAAADRRARERRARGSLDAGQRPQPVPRRRHPRGAQAPGRGLEHAADARDDPSAAAGPRRRRER